MRNLLEHPITTDEIVQCLTDLADQISNGPEQDMAIGDIRPLLLREAVKIITTSSPGLATQVVRKVLEECRDAIDSVPGSMFGDVPYNDKAYLLININDALAALPQGAGEPKLSGLDEEMILMSFHNGASSSDTSTGSSEAIRDARIAFHAGSKEPTELLRELFRWCLQCKDFRPDNKIGRQVAAFLDPASAGKDK